MAIRKFYVDGVGFEPTCKILVCNTSCFNHLHTHPVRHEHSRLLLDKLSAFSCISCSLLQAYFTLILVSKPTDNSTQNEFNNHSCNIFKRLDN